MSVSPVTTTAPQEHGAAHGPRHHEYSAKIHTNKLNWVPSACLRTGLFRGKGDGVWSFGLSSSGPSVLGCWGPLEIGQSALCDCCSCFARNAGHTSARNIPKWTCVLFDYFSIVGFRPPRPCESSFSLLLVVCMLLSL